MKGWVFMSVDFIGLVIHLMIHALKSLILFISVLLFLVLIYFYGRDYYR